MTLIELIMSIVVIALAGAALLGTLSYLGGTGNQSMMQAQAQSIATAYLNEITGKSFLDPRRRRRSACARSSTTSTTTTDSMRWRPTSSATRPAHFRVRVNVGPGTLGAIPAADVRRIDVTVDYGEGATVIATGYRTRYP